MKQFMLRSASIFAVLTLGTTAFAAKGSMGRSVGAGLAFPSSNQALNVNPSALPEAESMSLQGLWGFETEEPSVSLVGSQKSVGWGLGWMDNGTTNRFDGGFGVNLGGLMVGTDLYTTDFDGVDGDVALTFELSKIRLVTAFRGIDNGIDQFALGLGFNVNNLLISLDMYKNLPWADSDVYGFDTSFAYNAGKVSVGAGYDFIYNDGIENGEIHGDIAFAITNSIVIEGHYRLTPYATSFINEFSAGARVIF